MEAMEVDVVQQGEGPRAGEAPLQPNVGAAAAAAGGRSSQPVVIDSGSSTDIDDEEEEEEGGGGGPSVAPHAARLPTTWAFSQRAERDVPIRAAARAAATQVTTRRRRVRQGLRVHYPSQTANANPSRGFLDFLLRAPAANVAEPESGGSTTEPMSGSTTEVSDSDDEQPPRHAASPLVPADLALPSSLRVSSTPPQGPHPPTAPTAVTVRTEATQQSVQSAASAPAVSAPSSSVAAAPLRSSQGEDEGADGDNNCPICFEPFTAAGGHRLAALRCGHLFGFGCIDRWLRSQGQAAKCPQCNKKAKRSDVVLLYARKLKAMDNSEQESMKKSLEEEQSLRRRAELESAQCRLQLQVMTDECGKLRRQLQELKTLMSQANSGSSSQSSQHPSMLPGQSQRAGDASRSAQGAQYKFNKAVLVSQTGGCRVLAYCEPLSCLLASQNSPHHTLVPGCGVKKISAVNMKASQYVPIHAKQIRGLAFNRQADSLMLSASLDNTVKLTSLMTNTVVQTYNTGKPVWSCCWSLDNNNYVYAGLLNGAVLVYDTRDTSTHVHELQPQRSRCPVASLCFVPRAASSSFPCGGLIVGTLEGAYFWEQVDGTTYKPHMLPLETSGCTDIQVETESRHCLVTYRPGRSNPALRSVLMELQRTPPQRGDAAQEALCSCNPVQTFSAGASCKLLTKNAVFSSPAGDGATLVCVGDEASNSTLVWDAGTGALLQKLPADLPVLDISPFAVNGDHYLASLTEKMLKVYKWE